MAVKPVLLLGDPGLQERCSEVSAAESQLLRRVSRDLQDTLADFRRRWRTGSAIAAPQIGLPLRIVCFAVPGLPELALNPVFVRDGADTVEFWESCMSFPELLVRTVRANSGSLAYSDDEGHRHAAIVTGGQAVTVQHECDHLDGILAVSRAAPDQAFCLRSQWRRYIATRRR